MEKKAVGAFVILKILESACLGFIATTYVPFLLDQGLSLFQATQVNIAFMFVSTLLDPLTGSLADRIGQKKTYILGFFFVAIGTFVYGTGSHFWTFVLAESVAAIGTALWSKALESWIRTLYGKENCHGAMSKAGYFSKILSVAYGFAGSLLAARFGLRIPWFMGCTASLIAIVVGLIMTRNLPDTTDHDEGTRGSVRDSIKLIITTPELRFTAVISCVLSLAFQALNMFWSPVFRELSGSVGWLGFVWAGVALFSSAGYFLVRKRGSPNKSTIGTSILLTGIPVLVSALFFDQNLWVLVTGYLLHEVGRAATAPLLYTYSNDFVPDEIRSTVNSVFGSTGTIGAVVGLFVSGLLTEYITPVQVWVVSGIVLIALSGWILAYGKSK